MSINHPLGATPDTGTFALGTSAARHTALRRERLAQTGLAVVLLAALLLCVAAPDTDSLLPASVQPVQPTGMAGPFGATGLHLPLAALMFALSVMFGGYVLAVRGAERLSPRVVLMAIAGFNALVLLAPPLLSTDVFSYQAYARMFVSYGANPYVIGPFHAITQYDPLFSYIGAKWIDTPTAYGPLFTILSGLVATASVAVSALAFKASAAVASLATVALIWHAARLRGLNQVRSVALFGLNPLVVLYGVGGGHNDLLMLALTTAGVLALLAHRERASGGLIMLGTAIKLTGGLLLPFALASGVELGAGKRQRAILAGAVTATVLLAAASLAIFGIGPLHLIGTLRKVQDEGAWNSIPGFLADKIGLGNFADLAFGVIFLGVFGWLLAKVWRGQMDWIDGAAWATFAMLVTAGSLLPWYVAWLIPLVGLCTNRRLWTTAIVFTGIVQLITMVGYLPHSLAP
jgi:hypothetical protein